MQLTQYSVMLHIILLLFIVHACKASKEENLNDLGNDTLKDTDAMLNGETNFKQGNTTANNTSNEASEDFNVPWEAYITLLIKISQEQLENVKENTKKYYKLPEVDMKSVDDAFNDSNIDFEQMLQNNLKMIIESKKFNTTPEFLLDFVDLSNFILEQLVEYNLGRINGKLLLPTKWYKQIMRQKVLRQQTKIATNNVESNLCNILSLCKDRWYFTEYLVEWLRHILNLSTFHLNSLFKVIPLVIEKSSEIIKSNIKFRNTIKYIVNSNDVVQRDTIDYLDEVITNQKNIFNIIPEVLKKGATILVDLFKVIDDNYDLNETNEEQLEHISNVLNMWMAGKADITEFLEGILKNMQLNLKSWPLEVQKKIDTIWSAIISL